MNEIFGSTEAEELRAQLLKERKRRFAAEEKARALEQKLRESQPSTNSAQSSEDVVLTQRIESKILANTKPQIIATASNEDDFLLALHSPVKSSAAKNLEDERTPGKGAFPDFLSNHLRWIQENEVQFDETRAATDTPVRHWNDQDESQKALDELKKQNEELKVEISRLNADLDATKRLADAKTRLSELLEKEVSKSTKYVDRVKQVVLSKNDMIRSLLIDKRVATTLRTHLERVIEDRLHLAAENEIQRREIVSLREQCERLVESDARLREQLIQQTSQLIEKETTVAKMAQKLIDLKNRLSSITSVIAKYRAMRLYRIYPSAEAQLLVVHDGPSGERRLDVVIAGAKPVPHPASSIKVFEIVPNTLDRFNIVYLSGETEWYSSEMRDHLLVELQEFLFEENDVVFGVKTAMGSVAVPRDSHESPLRASPSSKRTQTPKKHQDHK